MGCCVDEHHALLRTGRRYRRLELARDRIVDGPSRRWVDEHGVHLPRKGQVCGCDAFDVQRSCACPSRLATMTVRTMRFRSYERCYMTSV